MMLLLLLEHLLLLLLHMSGRWWWRRCGFAMFWRCILLATIVVHRCSMLHQHIQTLLSGRSPFSGCSYGWMKERKSKQNKLSSLVSYIWMMIWKFISSHFKLDGWVCGMRTTERLCACATHFTCFKTELTSTCWFSAASFMGDLPYLSSDNFAPWLSSHRTTERWPRDAAKCNGVAPSPSRKFGSTPWSWTCEEKTRELCITNEYVWVSLGGWLWY